MKIRTIVAPLVGGQNDEATLSAGITVSKAPGAHLETCFVRPDPQDAVPYPGMDAGNLEEIREDHRRRAEVAGKKLAAKSRRQFNAACKKFDIAKTKRPDGQDGASAHWVEIVASRRLCLDARRSMRCSTPMFHS